MPCLQPRLILPKSFDSKYFPIIVFETNDGLVINDILSSQVCGSISFEPGFKTMGLVPNYKNDKYPCEDENAGYINIIGINN